VYILYHKRSKATSVILEEQKIIPFNYEKMRSISKKKWATNNLVQTDLQKNVFLREITNQILGISLISFLNFSLAAEHFIRMTNMQAAEQNIDENLEEMNLEYQQQRQEEITGELIDIIAGYQAI
jgi:F-type H+-transporting ATPase subunit gamma